jgi:WD repeat-containing protein 48
VNIGKWVLRNLFIYFIREEQRIHRKRDANVHDHNRQTSPPRSGSNHAEGNVGKPHRRSSSDSSRLSSKAQSHGIVIQSPKMIPAVPPITSTTVRSSPLLSPMIPISSISRDNSQSLSPIPQSPNTNDVTPMVRHLRSQTDNSHPPPSSKETDYFSLRIRQASASSGPTPDDSSSKQTSAIDPQTPNTPTGAAGLMGRLKNFGKSASKKAGDVSAVLPVQPEVNTVPVSPAPGEVNTFPFHSIS